MKSAKPTYRKRRLFPRLLHEVVTQATKPMMDQQGKLYGALLRDWAIIVGDSQAAICAPLRLQFPTTDSSGATLHLNVHPAHTPQFHYATAPIIEQCARYFGYKAIERIVLHSDYAQLAASTAAPQPDIAAATSSQHQKEVLTMLQTLKTILRAEEVENPHSADDKSPR